MSGDLLNWLTSFGCLLFTGAAVKLMDDYLDADFDICRGQRTLAVRLGRAALPYGLVLCMIGAYLNMHLAIALFFASYAVGMLTNWKERLPTRVPAYVETCVAIGLSVLFVGWHTTLFAVSLMAVVDWLDDLVDMSGDQISGQNNLALRIGIVETLFLILVALLIAVLSDAYLTTLAFVALTTLTILSEVTTSHLWKALEDDRGMGQ